MLNDWREMCHLAFKARWFGTPEEQKLMDIGDRPSIRWGSYFEQLVLGSGVGGKTIELTPKEFQSEYYGRVKRQAQTARHFIFDALKTQGYYFIEAQKQLICDFEIDGIIIPYEGNADALLGDFNKKPTLVLDTKYTGDTTNTWGKYAWGRPEEMDMGQLVGYSSAIQAIYRVEMPKSMYYVADSKIAERVEPIEVEFTEVYRQEYFWDLKECYKEINQSLSFDYWTHKASYNECSKCPIKATCSKAVTIPEIKKITK